MSWNLPLRYKSYSDCTVFNWICSGYLHKHTSFKFQPHPPPCMSNLSQFQTLKFGHGRVNVNTTQNDEDEMGKKNCSLEVNLVQLKDCSNVRFVAFEHPPFPPLVVTLNTRYIQSFIFGVWYGSRLSRSLSFCKPISTGWSCEHFRSTQTKLSIGVIYTKRSKMTLLGVNSMRSLYTVTRKIEWRVQIREKDHKNDNRDHNLSLLLQKTRSNLLTVCFWDV